MPRTHSILPVPLWLVDTAMLQEVTHTSYRKHRSVSLEFQHAAGVNCPLTRSGWWGQRSAVKLALFKRASNKAFCIFTACLKWVCIHTWTPWKAPWRHSLTPSVLSSLSFVVVQIWFPFYFFKELSKKRRVGHILTSHAHTRTHAH